MPQLNHQKIVKNLDILKEDIKSYNIFIESGTCLGNTIINLVNSFRDLHTIELSFTYYDYFNKLKIKENFNNVKNYFGDTIKVLPEILKSYTEKDKCIFWLDGHFSSGDTAQGEKDVPLIEECLLIDDLYKADKGVLFIDDFRLFGTKGAEDWSNISIDNICSSFKNFKIVENFVDEDILVLLIERL
jgi:hypothetical protein